jgi:GTP-binding protein Era
LTDAAAVRSGFVSLVGRPNTGKSTLINALVERKVAAVSPHPQTTRTHLLGILTRPQGQIVLVDTPGAHRGRGPLARALLRSLRAGLEGRDLALFLLDARRAWGAEDAMALDLLRGAPSLPVFLVLNKIDLLPSPEAALPILDAARAKFDFAETIAISALKRRNLDLLTELMFARMPLAEPYFPAGQTTDQPERFWISEVIREQAMLLTREEVPHALAVRIEGDASRRRAAGELRLIQAAIVCERPGQKAILVGKGGEMIRRIGIESRRALEAELGVAVRLELHVLVRAEWRENPRAIAGLDFRRES